MRTGEWHAELISLWNWRGAQSERHSVHDIARITKMSPNTISSRLHRLQHKAAIQGRGSPIISGASWNRSPKPPRAEPSIFKIMSSLATSVSSVRVASAKAKRIKQLGGQATQATRRAKSRPLTLPASSPVPVFIRVEPILLPPNAAPGETLFLSWPQIKTMALSDGKLLADMNELQSYNLWRERNGRAPVFVRRAAPHAHA